LAVSATGEPGVTRYVFFYSSAPFFFASLL